ncbi:hypothetical protein Acj9p101 [Acinetobacter phage Acj9]|uniref:Uncharacterized protein n=1 Tax=Acinetobacter phage Acj9 TaxID=760939 RepID=E5EPN5_9CAUD|nr:hypothetical protein Acj9p101 [Acinetobacter phage Acj9]ADG60001.1 hypothetical protein Acj9p101 [Acinetobacter phage Acj9]
MYSKSAGLIQLNKFITVISTRASRAHDARIEMGLLSLEFKAGKTKLIIDPNIREHNKQALVDIERIVHRYQFDEITSDNLEKLSKEIEPFAKKIVFVA